MPQNPPILADRPPISEAADPLQFLLLALHFSMYSSSTFISFFWLISPAVLYHDMCESHIITVEMYPPMFLNPPLLVPPHSRS